MKCEAKKISRILDELSTYFLSKDPKRLNISVDNLDDSYKISFIVCGIEYSEEEIFNMMTILNEPRQPSVEAYYWSLVGESSDDSELSLIGMMIDTAEIKFEDSNLYVDLYRLK